MQITTGKVVFIDYTLTDDDQEIIDSSRGGEPLGYVHGVGQLVPGLEAALEGRTAGESFQVVIAPEDGYGQPDPALVAVIPANEIEGVEDIEVGMQLEAETEEGEQTVLVTDVSPAGVTVDGNHPLAGVTLHFDVTVREVRDATPEELDHGHPHGDGGCGH